MDFTTLQFLMFYFERYHRMFHGLFGDFSSENTNNVISDYTKRNRIGAFICLMKHILV